MRVTQDIPRAEGGVDPGIPAQPRTPASPAPSRTPVAVRTARAVAGNAALNVSVERPRRDTIVLTVSGEIDTCTVERLRELLWHRLASCTATVVLDLSAVTFFNTSGLHLLAQCQRRAEQHDISFRVVRDEHGQIARLLDIADVSAQYLAYPDVRSALAFR